MIPSFVRSLQALNFRVNNNIESGDPTGTFLSQHTTDPKASYRQHAASTYLTRTAGRSNISVLIGAQVAKVNLDQHANDWVAVGADITVNGVKYIIRATKEIILCTGAFQIPQLLELSGIGQNSLLNKFGIECKIHLPGVGENLQDHLRIGVHVMLTSEAQGTLDLYTISYYLLLD